MCAGNSNVVSKKQYGPAGHYLMTLPLRWVLAEEGAGV
jgi:hypothetical protein